MTEKAFGILLTELALSKNHTLTKEKQKVFFKALGQLPHIEIVLAKAQLKHYEKWFPDVADLFKDHKAETRDSIPNVILLEEGKPRPLSDPDPFFKAISMTLNGDVSTETTNNIITQILKNNERKR